ncbi:MAG: histidine phosphatase family protein [Thermodesulfobacteriota bacterium]
MKREVELEGLARGAAPGRLILVRHGESEGNQARRFSPNPEIGLTPAGVEQARESGRVIARHFRPSRIVASSYRRARLTAEIIAREVGHAADILVEHDLRERAIGELAGQPYTAMREHPEYSVERFWEWRPAGGESLVDVRDRAAPVLVRLTERFPGEDVVVVSHGGVMLALCAYVESGWTRPRVARNCEVLVVTHAPGQPWRLAELAEHVEPAGGDGAAETG